MKNPPVDLVTLSKVIRIIESCKTTDQLRVAFNVAKCIKYQPQWLDCLDSLVDKCDMLFDSKDLLRDIAHEHHLRHSRYSKLFL